ncbi:MAG: hypothetical protein PHQ59_05320 [Candidatus Daviesbacteria bacterium]|nr:hypothetical protein [Candidatus Daviesbacteria bacterium]
MSLREAIKEVKNRGNSRVEQPQRPFSAEGLMLANECLKKTIRQGKTLAQCKAMLDESTIDNLFAEVNRDHLDGLGKFSEDSDICDVINDDRFIDVIEYSYAKRLRAFGKNYTVRLISKAFISDSVGRELTNMERPRLWIACLAIKERGVMNRIIDKITGRKVPSKAPSERFLYETKSESGELIREWQDVGMVKNCLAEVLVEQGVV